MDNDNDFLPDFDLDDQVEALSEELEQDEQATVVLGEAIKRIEQAKLYETLLKHRLFGADSARPEIINAVEKEIKAFILSRLEVLLGIRAESQAAPARAESPFSPEETEALRAIASKLLAKDKAVHVTQPTLNTVRATTSPSVTPVSVKQPTVNRVGGSKPQAQPSKKPGRRPKSQNVSSVAIQRPDGTVVAVETDYSQAVNPNRPPAAMPSQAQIDQMNAAQAAANSGSGGNADALGRLLNMAANQMIARNQNVKE